VQPTAHLDTFVRDHLPPLAQWPDLLFDIPEVRYPARLNCAVELLDDAVAGGAGERIAIYSGARRLTYRELLSDANRVAAVLRDQLRLVPGARVLLRGYNDATTVACWYGILKAGCIAVTTMPLLRAIELHTVIERARVDAALCDARLTAELDAAVARSAAPVAVVRWNDASPESLAERMTHHDGTFENVATAADDPCLVAFTSGTTGRPKATVHFHRDVLAICDTFAAQHVRATEADVFCGTPPLAFTFGLGGLLLFPARARAGTLLLENPAPETLLGAIAGNGVTICFAAPTAYRAMIPLAARYDLRSLRACVSAGEALPVATREAWKTATGIDLIDGIGATEMLHIFIAASGNEIRPGATGKPVRGFQAAILDDEGNQLGPGHVGRLAVKGPTGCRYLADGRQTEYVEGGWNVTGDAYLVDDEGYYWYQARTDDMIVSSGYNIAGPEIEGVLLGHASVRECAVVGAPDPDRGAIVKAFVVLHEGFTPNVAAAERLQKFVKSMIAPYKYPRAIEFVESLPRTESGKLQRYRLRERAAEVT
jgi:2-aminobenzoate-CoA ligase